MRPLARALLLLAGLALLVCGGGYLYVRGRGLSARAEPSRLEGTVARFVRSLAIPADARNKRSPSASSPESIRRGLEHFADHCAVCHANDGSGDTEIGRSMYPRAPDMRRAPTQSLSDGELFYVIERGIPLTGMPAWGTGTAESEAESWQLVHFIRHLPHVTDQELEEMAALNPKSDDEWRQEEEGRRFLEGGAAPPPNEAAPHHKHGGR
jgi:mono/diheme cytochrome c family protein